MKHDYDAIDPCHHGFEEMAEEENARRAGYVPSFCRTEDEYRDWLRGDLTEAELRIRHTDDRGSTPEGDHGN